MCLARSVIGVLAKDNDAHLLGRREVQAGEDFVRLREHLMLQALRPDLPVQLAHVGFAQLVP
eukprot:CAMPEP_0113277430 /NCGR_PEP_ID=MMETSP0008_2-20120614/26043_1 /TAXON_ID=97485 /ORGANISM="Prymnesium parvum" /LENGTH=61 /DNA_ID=CAMNT_0000127339 /DNA_START=606 /DNA_END=791 /DNA_ORIENTATION=- /assembly_acc=CAM_ASM_000153